MTGGGGPPGRKLPRLDNPCVDFKRVLRDYVWSGRGTGIGTRRGLGEAGRISCETGWTIVPGRTGAPR